MAFSRRHFLELSLASLAASSVGARVTRLPGEAVDGTLAKGVMRRALAALEAHADRIAYRDFIGIADFSLPSCEPRLYVVALANGAAQAHWVAHGRGSDPAHTGWLKSFSNEAHSNATSAGAYRTVARYVGAHGQSMRLEGLDVSNDNALSRGIVMHAASYVSAQMISDYGKLGRSEGCFAMAESSLPAIMARLAPGRMIYADKV